eukprot:scaffold2214_cov49-Phaeocystis_antarctica.AAC.3
MKQEVLPRSHSAVCHPELHVVRAKGLVGLLDRELKLDLLAGQPLVDGGEGVDLVLDVGRLLRVQVYLDDLGAVQAVARVLADDLSGVHQVLQDRLVHGGERSATRPLLLGLPLARGRLAHNPALADDDDVLARELLLKLTRERRHRCE